MSKIFNLELNTATPQECACRWCLGKPGEYFRCGFCGHKFKEGDKWRGIYTNDLKDASGNPLVCEACNADNATLRDRWTALSHEWASIRAEPRFWWFNRRLEYS